MDIQDIPEVVRNDMEFVLLRNVDDALKEVLVKDSGKPSKRNVKKDTANDDKKS